MTLKRERLVKSSGLALEVKGTRLVNLGRSYGETQSLINREIW